MVNYPYNPAQSMIDSVEYFEKVDRRNGGDGVVWVKSTAPQGMQVIIEVKNSQGRPMLVPPITPGDPVCLSKSVGNFDLLREAEQIHQNVSNGNLRLMTSKEARAFFEKKADKLKLDVDTVMQKADAAVRSSTSRFGKTASDVDESQSIARESEERVNIEDVINPKIHNLCNQVSDPLLKDNERISVREFMDELINLEDFLSLEDLVYVEAKGYYPSVKKWSQQKQAEIREVTDPKTDELLDA